MAWGLGQEYQVRKLLWPGNGVPASGGCRGRRVGPCHKGFLGCEAEATCVFSVCEELGPLCPFTVPYRGPFHGTLLFKKKFLFL